jgi:hypothetical protein
MQRRASQRYTAPEFKPYVTALGQLALAWNDLQESLADLFWTAMMNGPPVAGDVVNYAALWVWHSIRSDRSQREMLKAAINRSSVDWKRPKFQEDANWLLKKIVGLEDRRNDAIHSPLFLTTRSLWGVGLGPEKIAPAVWLFNPRAIKLSERTQLLSEFRYCRDTSITLADYARAINGALINPRRPWPDKPSLPNPGKKKGRQGSPPRPK